MERILTRMSDQLTQTATAVSQNTLTLADLLKLAQKDQADMTLAEARINTLVQSNATQSQQIKDLTAQLLAAKGQLQLNDPNLLQQIADTQNLIDSHINGILPDGTVNTPVITLPSTDPTQTGGNAGSTGTTQTDPTQTSTTAASGGTTTPVSTPAQPVSTPSDPSAGTAPSSGPASPPDGAVPDTQASGTQVKVQTPDTQVTVQAPDTKTAA